MSGERDDTIPAASPPISASTQASPQEALLQRGAFDPPTVAGTLGRLDRFEVLRLIGEGGMGQVFLAREPRTETKVAIKVLKPRDADDPQAVHRFLTEARHMYQLSHPRILRVLEVSEGTDTPYYVMPYIAGGNLQRQYTPGQPMPTDRAQMIARQVAEALAYSHSRGIIHRDLKPANVLVDAGDNTYLTDFGLVRTVFNDSIVDPSVCQLEGTAHYMSPAVARGEAEDTRCDIYAFGALLYELLTGQPPYTGRTPHMTISQVLKGPPTPILQVNPKADPSLVKIAEGCMARELRDRYASMADVVADFDRVITEQAPLGPHRQNGNHRWLRIAAALAAVLVVVGVVAGVWYLTTHSGGRSSTGAHAPLSRTSPGRHTSPGGSSRVAPKPGESGSPTIVAAENSGPPTVPDGPTTDEASPALTDGPFSYTVTDGTVTITKYTGPGGKVTIPSMIDGLPVTTVGYRTFSGCTGLTSVAIPSGVTGIGDFAFHNCSQLTSVTIPNSVISIGRGAFGGCGLTSVTIPDRLPAIEEYVFAECGSLASVVIPASVTKVGGKAFLYCGNLTSITFPDTLTEISASGAFRNCIRLVNITIPEGVTSIGEYTFAGCASLSSVTIPGSMTSIAAVAFRDCPLLQGIYFKGDAPSLGDGAFLNTPNATIYYRAGATGWDKEFGGRPTAAWDPDEGPTAAPAVDLTGAKVEGPYSYTVVNGRISIVKYTGPGGAVTIPGMIGGLPVTTINNSAFAGCTELTSVAIPAGVTAIDWTAFNGCTALKSIDVAAENATYRSEGSVLFNKAKTTLFRYPPGKAGAYAVPKGITKIDRGAFVGCGGLTAISLPDGVGEIGISAFHSCGRLTAIAIPGTVTQIGDSAFNRCEALTDVRLAEGVTHIGQYVFAYCKQLSTVSLPASVASLAPNAFLMCPNLKAINVDPGNKVYSSDEAGVVFDKERTVLVKYPCGRTEHYEIPEGVTKVRESAFEGAATLTSVVYPASIERIDGAVCAYANALTAICFGGDAPQLARPDQLATARSVTVWYRPGTKGWGKEFGGRPTAMGEIKGDFLIAENRGIVTLVRYFGPGGDIAIPATIDGVPVGCIGREAFKNCAGLTGVTIPGSVTTIDQSAFQDCTELANVTITAGVAKIMASAFHGCASLTQVSIPTSVTDLQVNAFAGCTRLEAILVDERNPNYCSEDGVLLSKDKTKVLACPQGKRGAFVVPKGVVEIGESAFRDCTNLTGVAIPVGVTNIVGNPFEGCRALTAITVHPSNPAFTSVDGVVLNKEKTAIVCFPGGKPGSYAIPASVTSIGWGAFIGAAGLTNVTIPNGVIAIESYAFKFCSALTDVAVPKSVKTIGAVAFGNCGKLTNFTIPDMVTRVDRQTFAQCRNLISVTIPESVTEIVWGAFQVCPNLSTVCFKGDAPTLGNGVFDGSSRATVYYRAGTKGWGKEFGGRPTAVWDGKTMPANQAETK